MTGRILQGFNGYNAGAFGVGGGMWLRLLSPFLVEFGVKKAPNRCSLTTAMAGMSGTSAPCNTPWQTFKCSTIWFVISVRAFDCVWKSRPAVERQERIRGRYHIVLCLVLQSISALLASTVVSAPDRDFGTHKCCTANALMGIV